MMNQLKLAARQLADKALRPIGQAENTQVCAPTPLHGLAYNICVKSPSNHVAPPVKQLALSKLQRLEEHRLLRIR